MKHLGVARFNNNPCVRRIYPLHSVGRIIENFDTIEELVDSGIGYPNIARFQTDHEVDRMMKLVRLDEAEAS